MIPVLVRVRVNVDPQTKRISFELDGDHDDILAFNLSDFGKLSAKIQEFASAIGAETTLGSAIRTTAMEGRQSQQAESKTTGPVLSIPADILEKLSPLDERTRIPVIWYFSSKPSMTVNEFLIAAAKDGVGLSPSWAPSEGGNFRNRLVKKDNMFAEDGQDGKTTRYRLTELAAIKVKKTLAELKTTKADQHA